MRTKAADGPRTQVSNGPQTFSPRPADSERLLADVLSARQAPALMAVTGGCVK